MSIIEGYVLKNEDGHYLSMSCDLTTNWFEASKFDENGIESRKAWIKAGFKLCKFQITECDSEVEKL